MGPSGSGKTTLLAILAGFEEPQQGEVASQALSDELAASQTGLHGAHIGIVFQSLGLLPSLTAEENVVLPLLHAGMKLQRASGRAGEWLNRLGLGERKRHRVNELSLGQQQRVAVARALATEPRIVLADEPTAEVDEKAASIIVDALHEVTDRGGGVIVASHDTRLSATADRVLLLRGGRLAASA
jgi:putative ABC transport system ATP-binding protein